jgi:hypothetical protein
MTCTRVTAAFALEELVTLTEERFALAVVLADELRICFPGIVLTLRFIQRETTGRVSGKDTTARPFRQRPKGAIAQTG